MGCHGQCRLAVKFYLQARKYDDTYISTPIASGLRELGPRVPKNPQVTGAEE